MALMFRRFFSLLLALLSAILLLGGSSLSPTDQTERIRVFTRAIEFDYLSWTLNALGVKLGQEALRTGEYIPESSQSQLVLDYLKLVNDINTNRGKINQIYSDPNITDPKAASAVLQEDLTKQEQQLAKLEPLAETILQNQISVTAAQLNLTFAGQPIPPVLYRTTPPPDALIISPRNVIRQDADISISAKLTIDQITALEENVDQNYNVSSLVVGIGGIGLYPTMVMRTTDINWLTEVVAHEWVHNFLTLRPLGISYLSTPELRIMNETAASLGGKEISRAVIEKFYPAYLPVPAPASSDPTPALKSEPTQAPVFDFQSEMHQTRITVDSLLSEGKIEQAENYMEERRRIFWENRYPIRKLNQAYFAFYGAYADTPGGAAGEDPVGAAVRSLRAQSPSLASFFKSNILDVVFRPTSTGYDQSKELISVKNLTRLYHKFHRCANFILNLNIHKLRNTDDVNAIIFQITARQHQCFDCLVNRTGTDCLYICMTMFSNNSSNCTRDG